MSVPIFRIAIIFLLLPAMAFCITVEVLGASPMLRHQVERLVSDLSESELGVEVITEEVCSLLRDEGYLSPEIAQEEDMLIIDAGNQYRIAEIVVEVEKPLTESEVVSLISVRQGDIARVSIIESELGKVITLLHNLGYYHPEVDYKLRCVSDNRVDLLITVESGSPGYIKDIRISGASVFSKLQILNETGLGRVRCAVKPSDIACAVFSVKKMYREAGYGDVRVEPTMIEVDEDGGIHITLSIYEGELQKVMRIVIEGNTKTRDEVILRELTFRPGDILREKDVNRSKKMISRLAFIRGSPEIEYDNGVVKVVVREGRAGAIDGGLGVSPGSGEDTPLLIGDIKLRLNNIAGTGRELTFSYASWGEGTMDVKATYREPWVAHMPIDLEGRFSCMGRMTYRKVGAEGGLIGRVIGAFSVEGGGGFEMTNRDCGRDTHDYYGYTGIIYDTLPKGEIPREGGIIHPRLDYGIRKMVGFGSKRDLYEYKPDNLVRVRLTGEGERYFSAGLLVFMLGMRGGIVHIGGEGLEDGDMFEVGGVGSLRGYRRGAFIADRYATLTCEVHLMMGERAYLYPFVDAGVMHNGDSMKAKLGYGVGIGVDVGVGLLRLSYALGQGGLSEGMVNIGLEMW